MASGAATDRERRLIRTPRGKGATSDDRGRFNIFGWADIKCWDTAGRYSKVLQRGFAAGTLNKPCHHAEPHP
jgi:hypothetical protein